MSEGEYCTDKLRSSSGGELQSLVEVGEESIAQTLDGDSAAKLSGEGRSRARVATEETADQELVFESRVNPVMNSSTPVKLMEGGGYGSSLLELTPVGTPVKRVSNVKFADG